MIAGLAVSILIAFVGIAAIVIGVGLFYSGQFVGFPMIVVGVIILIIVGVLNIRR